MRIRGIQYLKNYEKAGFFLIAGPCIIENEKITTEIASKVIEITDRLEIPVIFKASYRKANRSRSDSFTGIGDIRGLEILKNIREQFKIPVITDIHNPAEASLAASYDIDILQIPAFLSRQTDLLEAAAETGKHVNIKKGQFLSPASMKFAAEKVSRLGNNNILITERGTQFGYTDLVVDFRSVPIMKSLGYPVVLDVTHSLQQPNQSTGVSGGLPELIETMAKAGIAAGVDGIFLETHPRPSEALSDGANMLKLDMLEDLLIKLKKISEIVQQF